MDKCNLYIFLKLLWQDLCGSRHHDPKRPIGVAYSLDQLGFVIL